MPRSRECQEDGQIANCSDDKTNAVDNHYCEGMTVEYHEAWYSRLHHAHIVREVVRETAVVPVFAV